MVSISLIYWSWLVHIYTGARSPFFTSGNVWSVLQASVLIIELIAYNTVWQGTCCIAYGRYKWPFSCFWKKIEQNHHAIAVCNVTGTWNEGALFKMVIKVYIWRQCVPCAWFWQKDVIPLCFPQRYYVAVTGSSQESFPVLRRWSRVPLPVHTYKFSCK